MAKVDKPIIRARFTDAAHKHAYVWLQGEGKPMMISELDHPDLWHEMRTSVAMTHYQADAPATAPVAVDTPTLPVPALPTPVSQALAVVPTPATNVVPMDPKLYQTIAALEARVRELEMRPSGSLVDLDDIADKVSSALDKKLAELRKSIPHDAESRLTDLENILLNINQMAASSAA